MVQRFFSVMPRQSPPPEQIITAPRNTTLVGPSDGRSHAPPAVSILVCLIGSLRGGEQAWRSMYENLLHPLRAHLGVLVSYEDSASSSSLLRHATHVWRVGEYRDWGDLLDELQGRAWRETASLSTHLWGGVVNPSTNRTIYGSGAIMLCLRMVLLGYLDAMRGHTYHQLVLTRSDYYYACAHPALTAADGEVLIPYGEAPPHGLSDRHTVFSFVSRRTVLGVLPWLLQQEARVEARHRTKEMNRTSTIEHLLGVYFRQAGLTVTRFRRTFFAVGDRRKGDRTRFRGIGYPIPPSAFPGVNLWCKYDSEMREATDSCSLGVKHYCTTPESADWVCRNGTSDDGVGWVARAGSGFEPHGIIAQGMRTERDAHCARLRWLRESTPVLRMSEKDRATCLTCRLATCTKRCRYFQWFQHVARLANPEVKSSGSRDCGRTRASSPRLRSTAASMLKLPTNRYVADVDEIVRQACS